MATAILSRRLFQDSLPRDAGKIIFTDQPAPLGGTSVDVSATRDGGVILWSSGRKRYGETYYITTQRPGVKVVAPSNCAALLMNYGDLESIDVTMLDTSQVTTMEKMFMYCRSLREVTGMRNWDVGKVKNMAWLFGACLSIRSLGFLSKWDISHVETMEGMFWVCESLRNVDGLTSWRVNNVKDFHGMFAGCTGLKNTKGIANWRVNKNANTKKMFEGCYVLSERPAWYNGEV
jgi:surface protein